MRSVMIETPSQRTSRQIPDSVQVVIGIISFFVGLSYFF